MSPSQDLQHTKLQMHIAELSAQAFYEAPRYNLMLAVPHAHMTNQSNLDQRLMCRWAALSSRSGEVQLCLAATARQVG